MPARHVIRPCRAAAAFVLKCDPGLLAILAPMGYVVPLVLTGAFINEPALP